MHAITPVECQQENQRPGMAAHSLVFDDTVTAPAQSLYYVLYRYYLHVFKLLRLISAGRHPPPELGWLADPLRAG